MEQKVCNAAVHYEWAGEGATRVVLLHGWGCNMELMRGVAESLKANHRVLLIDFPGFGSSGRPPEPWGVPEYAACLYQLLKELDFLPCAAVGHSFGCRVIAYLAAENHDVFTKIVFTGAAGLRKPQTEEGKKRSERYQKLKKIADRADQTGFFGNLPEKAREKLRRKYGSADYNALDAEMRKTFVKVISQDLQDCYSRIQQPVLLLWGDQDTETPLWMGEKMEKLIPDAGLVIFEGGTHFAYMEQLNRFNTVVGNFLQP